ncbi:unnamed protein product, partial [Chrysoparadoxa australica]
FYLKPFKISTQSMEEVIEAGDIALTAKKTFLSYYKKNDVLSFIYGEDKTTFIKRIVASEGDTLKIYRNEIKIGETGIPHDPIFEMMVEDPDRSDSTEIFSASKYLNYILRNLPDIVKERSLLESENSLIVPEGYYFMVGDNYYKSMDSRFWGLIPRENIDGKVVLLF